MVHRVEKHIIKKSHNMYKIIDDYAFKVKNLYNYANYIVRQDYIGQSKARCEVVKLNEELEEKLEVPKIKIIKEFDLSKIVQKSEPADKLMAATVQQTIKILSQNWKSFFASITDYWKNPSKYTGRPKLPNYKDKEKGRFVIVFTNQNCKLKNEQIQFPKIFNKWKLNTKIQGKLQQVRIVPRNNQYVVEIVYETTENDKLEDNKRYIGVDIGVDNFATIGSNFKKAFILNGKGLKSINQYYNKRVAHLKSVAMQMNNKFITNKVISITNKRHNKITDIMHKYSKYLIDFAIENNCNTIIIGNNKDWKRECPLSKRVNQNFVNIPHQRFIEMIQYKCENVGINCILTEESYTSGTSFLDKELPTKEHYNKKRRIKRGLFKSNNGTLINSDLNGAYQIIKKVVPNAFADGIDGVVLHPVRVG